MRKKIKTTFDVNFFDRKKRLKKLQYIKIKDLNGHLRKIRRYLIRTYQKNIL